MAALFSRIHTWVSNEVLTSSDLNAEFDNILTNAHATTLNGYSQDVATMRTTVSPGGSGTESLASSIADELARIRYVFKLLSGQSQWYVDPGRTLAAGGLAVGSADLTAAVTGSFTPTGSVLAYGGTAAPTGYLMCDGLAVSRTTYSGLFTVIASTHGSGDGSTTFNVPDYRGQFIRGFIGTMGGAITALPGSNNATITAHGFNRTGIPIQLTGGTVPTGLAISTTYYTIYVDANTIAFADTLAHAIAGTKIALSGSAAGTVVQWMDPDASSRVKMAAGGNTGSNVGTVQQDQFASHTHTQQGSNINSNNGGSGSPNMAGTGFSASETLASGGNETRAKNAYANYIIKT